MLRHPSGGAVAVWGPTGLGLSKDHLFLAEGFMDTIFSNPQSGIGIATIMGKLKLADQVSEYDDLIDTFILFGDPAMQMTPFGFMKNSLYLPLVIK